MKVYAIICTTGEYDWYIVCVYLDWKKADTHCTFLNKATGDPDLIKIGLHLKLDPRMKLEDSPRYWLEEIQVIN